jgi:hypothetical protein
MAPTTRNVSRHICLIASLHTIGALCTLLIDTMLLCVRIVCTLWVDYAQVMIGALDPSRPDVRKACLKSSTKGLHELVKRYPMASFNQVCVGSGLLWCGIWAFMVWAVDVCGVLFVSLWCVRFAWAWVCRVYSFDSEQQRLIATLFNCICRTPNGLLSAQSQV